MNFLRVTDNVSDTYYINIENIAYLKESVTLPKPIYKIVLVNEKQILISNKVDFERIRSRVFGELV